jgi:hypothetical protein
MKSVFMTIVILLVAFTFLHNPKDGPSSSQRHLQPANIADDRNKDGRHSDASATSPYSTQERRPSVAEAPKTSTAISGVPRCDFQEVVETTDRQMLSDFEIDEKAANHKYTCKSIRITSLMLVMVPPEETRIRAAQHGRKVSIFMTMGMSPSNSAVDAVFSPGIRAYMKKGYYFPDDPPGLYGFRGARNTTLICRFDGASLLSEDGAFRNGDWSYSIVLSECDEARP